MVETRRVELGAGRWAELRTRFTVRAQELTALGVPEGAKERDTGKRGTSGNAIMELCHADGSDLSRAEQIAFNKASVLGMVHSWSYGPVTMGVMDDEVEAEDFPILQAEVEAIISALPLAAGRSEGSAPAASSSS